MSGAGTPAADPWVIQPRERTWYEEQFKSLGPNNGIVTGKQAKGFLLQSQLPPPILGQIWSLSDTDADGKMDINEFSIACKLIYLKLKGTEVPKVLPSSLINSLKSYASSNTSSPITQQSLIGGPPNRPQQSKIDPTLHQPSLVPAAPIIPQAPIANSNINLLSQVPTAMPAMGAPLVQTAVVPPLVQQPLVQPTIPPQSGIIPPLPQTNFGSNVRMRPPVPAPLVPGLANTVPPMSQTFPTASPAPAIPPLPQQTGYVAPMMQTAAPSGGVPVLPTAPQPVIPGVPPVIPGAQSVIPPAVAPIIPPVQVVSGTSRASISSLTGMSPAGSLPPSVPGSVVQSTAPSIASSTPRASIDKGLSDMTQTEWAVSHQTKLKYTQLFNTTDRARTGYLSGAQARNVMVQSKLPQNILAQIWALSDMDADGQLGCEEFVLAMHLCEQATQGNMPPTVLPPELIPPTFRRLPRTGSISSQGSVPQDTSEHASLHHQNSFEDKRKENFEKGQAELERRRKALLEAQRKEAEERERKEREENERKERARQEAEKKRLMELEAQLREQQEQERLKEEERKRQAEQRETARKEMERQRQLEWEKQRSQELQQQRQREQETVLKLKAKNQSLTIELTSLNDQVKELSQKICDTRVGVSNIKTTIDGMRTTRDYQMQEMSQLKNKLKEQNARLLALSHEKIKLEAKNKMNTQQSDDQVKAFENKEIKIKQLKDKLEDMQNQIQNKMSDIENNNSQLTDLKTQLKTLVNDCESLYTVYEEKKNQVLELKGSRNQNDYNTAWKDTNSWDTTTTSDEWPVDNWSNSATTEEIPSGTARYRALYEFVARNQDEVSFQPGDIILVPLDQTGEPGWLAGEIRGHTGWFPESYVEPIDSVPAGSIGSVQDETPVVEENNEAKRLELIAEVPETLSDISVDPNLNQQPPVVEPIIEKIEVETEEFIPETTELEYYVASYPYQSQETGDLSFNAGDIIIVTKKEGDWWTGKNGNNVGIFPSNYVQKTEINSVTATTTTSTTTTIATTNNIDQSQAQDSGTDNEVCQINDSTNTIDSKNIDFSQMGANTQTLKSGKKPEIASVIAPYQASSPEQLSLQRGQLIMVRKKTDSGWWEGELQAKGKRRQVGWFPASYVKVLSSSGRASGRTTPVSTTRMQQEVIIDKVIALFPYTANNPDELSFLKDDIISVTARDEPSWWRGELNGVSGMFPSNYVGPLQLFTYVSYGSQEKVRQDCINELILTEEAYINDMTNVHKIFEIPLRMSNAVTEEEVEGIFVNWQEIMQCNRRFLEDLFNRRESGSTNIGDIICNHLPLMTGYITFCSNQLDSAALLQRLTEQSVSFRDLVKKCQSNKLTNGMPLSSFLIKPMQRITKYPLLIGKILENTPINHSDHYNLTEALKKADMLCKQINEGVRVKENSERLEWLQTHVNCDDFKIKFNSYTNCLGLRRLLHYGMLQKLKSGKELIGFLLNDFLLLVQPNKPIGTKFTFQHNNNYSFKMYKQPIFIHDVTVLKCSTEIFENGTDVNRVLKVSNRLLALALLAPTANECNLWIKKIEEAKSAFNNSKLLHRSKGICSPRIPTPYAPAFFLLNLYEIKGIEIFNEKKKTLSLKRGKSFNENIFCKVTMGDQEQVTDIAKDVPINGNMVHNGQVQIPILVWNTSMQFHVKNINQDILIITIYEKCLFTPDEFLGRAELKIQDIVRQTRNINGPILKRLILHQVESGEVEIKLDLQMFDS